MKLGLIVSVLLAAGCGGANAVDKRSGRTIITIDPKFYRPTEVDLLIGDPSKARQRLGWRHRVSFDSLVEEMVDHDISKMREANVRRRVQD